MLDKVYYSLIKNNLSTPIYLILYVTNRCNARCAHCFYGINNPTFKDLSTEEIEKFSKQLGRVVWLSLTGGEPFIRQDIDKVYEIFRTNNQVSNITIPTNGFFVQSIYKKTKAMLEKGPVESLSINLSLDGTKEYHDEMRKLECYEKVFDAYNLLSDLKEEFPYLFIKVNTVITKFNINLIEDLHKDVWKRMPNLDHHNFEIVRGDPYDKNYVAPTMEELIKIRPFIFSVWDKYNFYGRNIKSTIANNAKKMLFDFYLDTIETQKRTTPCYAGIVHSVLDSNGDLYFCELLSKVGNIRQNTFQEIWNSDKAKELRKSIDEKKCHCTHSCFHNTNLTFDQKNWLKLIQGTRYKPQEMVPAYNLS